MRKASILFLISAALSFGQTGVYPPASGGGGSSYYQTAESNGTAVTQRPRFNFVPGSGMTITPTDNGTDTSTFTFASTGGGGSATLITQLLDLAPGTPTSTAIPFGGSCTVTTPCYVHIGSTRYPFTNTATVNITAGTASDVILFGLDGSGNRTIWYNSANTYTCPNCENAPVGGTSAFPANSTPIWGCSVTSGAFTGTSCAAGSGLLGDDRDIFGSTHLSGSLGISLVPNSPSAGNTAINLAEIPRIVGSSTSTDTITNADCGNQITYTDPSGTAVTLPAANLGGQFLPGCAIEVRAQAGTGTVTITPQGGSTIDGASTLSVTAGQGQRIIADNSGSPGNYQLGTGGQAGGSFLPTTGGTMTGTITSAQASTTDAYDANTSLTTSSLNVLGMTNGSQQWKLAVTGSTSGVPNAFILSDVTGGFSPIIAEKSTGIVHFTKGIIELVAQVTPATSMSTCTTGTMEADANYIYVCTATNTWKRATLATF